jgi:tetratricopeptide (TPR) repeat protein
VVGAFLFLTVAVQIWIAPEIKFRNALDEAEGAERAGDWDRALDAYCRADTFRKGHRIAAAGMDRVLTKRDADRYAQAMKRGVQAEQSKNWELALKEFETALSQKVDDVEAKSSTARINYNMHMEIGRQAEQARMWQAANMAYHRALQFHPKDAEATKAISRVDFSAALAIGEKSEEQNRISDAILAFRRALRLQPDSQIANDAIQRLNEKLIERGNRNLTTSNKLASAIPPTHGATLNLEWKRDGLANSSQAGADKSETTTTPNSRVVNRILDKSGTEQLSISAIPDTDENAWTLARKQTAISGSPEKLYRLLGEQLLAADHL